MKSLRQRIREGKTVIGSWINTGSPIVAELMAQAGAGSLGSGGGFERKVREGSKGGRRFDFLCVDAEHSAVDLPQVQQLFQAIRSGNPDCAALVRVPGCDYAQIKRYMDAGAAGVICPLVNTAEQAKTVVEAVRYPGGSLKSLQSLKSEEVGGRRGVGFCRDNEYGVKVVERVKRSNVETVVGVQIEDIRAVENIDGILAVPGVDVAFIGPYDLTASMGIMAQFEHPRYLRARKQILAACRRHKVAAGIHIVQPDVKAAKQAIRQGYRFLAYSLDITMLTVACRSGLAAIRG